jgi:hypothetical protein
VTARRARATLIALVLTLPALVGCGASPKASEAPSAPTASSAPVASGDHDVLGSQRADAEVAEALELVARVRQLSVRARVPGFLLNRAELQREVERTLKDEAPDALIAGNTELLYAFDVVGADFDLKAALTKMYGAQLAGFYDPDKDRMVLASDLSKDEQALTLYHELVHALQDQHYDLAGELDWKPEESDRQTALQALAEGDATLAMLDVARAAAGMGPGDFPAEFLQIDALLMQASPKLDEVPGFLVRAMVSPYADGLRFVSELRKSGGWGAVNDVWRQRPISTEQILHPEKYLAREPVQPVPPLALPAGFDAPSFRDVMGEQGIKLLFEEWAPAAAAASAATGWGGDRIAVAASSAGTVVFWHLAFDDEDAARRALVLMARGALRDELGSGSPRVRPTVDAATAETAAGSGRFCQQRRERGAFAIVRHGQHLGVTLGPYRRGQTADASADKCPDALGWADSIARQR